MPVWRVLSDYGDGAEVYWAFVAAPDAKTARVYGDPHGTNDCRIAVCSVGDDGRMPRVRKPQATVETEAPYELGDEELAAFHWRTCDVCCNYVRADKEHECT